MESPWTSIPPAMHHPWLLPPVNRGILFGGKVLHYSHRLVWYRGVVYCRHCGYYSQGKRAQKLVKRCPSKPVATQARLLDKMKQGTALTSKGWPLPLEAQCPLGLKPYVAEAQA